MKIPDQKEALAIDKRVRNLTTKIMSAVDVKTGPSTFLTIYKIIYADITSGADETEKKLSRTRDALHHIHDYAKTKSLADGKFIERCAYTALAATVGD